MGIAAWHKRSCLAKAWLGTHRAPDVMQGELWVKDPPQKLDIEQVACIKTGATHQVHAPVPGWGPGQQQGKGVFVQCCSLQGLHVWRLSAARHAKGRPSIQIHLGRAGPVPCKLLYLVMGSCTSQT
jgi:hypothetical protein